LVSGERGQATFHQSKNVKGSRFEVGGGHVIRIAHGAESIALKKKCCGAAVMWSNEKISLALDKRNKTYFLSNKTKYSSLVIPAVLRLFLIIDTGTSS